MYIPEMEYYSVLRKKVEGVWLQQHRELEDAMLSEIRWFKY